MAGTETSKEPDRERARTIAEDGCILRSVVGSTVHGLGHPATDDRDEMGVCVEPPEYVLGLRPFEHFVFRTQSEGSPSGPGDLDLTIYGLQKYCRLALKGSPTTLLLLFVQGAHVMVCTPLGEELQRLAPAFVSRRTGRAFLGYLDAQRRSLIEGKARERERSSAHGYDTKYAMHALRIAHQGIELLSAGHITLPVPEPARARLMDVRHGRLPLDEVLSALDADTEQLATLSRDPNLPAEGDRAAVDCFLISAYERAWEESAAASAQTAGGRLAGRTPPPVRGARTT